MKKILSILGIITLIGASTISSVACDYVLTVEELTKLKEENKIDTKNQEIRNNLEWIAPQEKPFKQIDNKYYFVVWRSNKKNDWIIVKFKNNTLNFIKIDSFGYQQLEKTDLGMGRDLYITNESGIIKYVARWKNDSGMYFKAVYRWNLDIVPPSLVVNNKTSEVKVKK